MTYPTAWDQLLSKRMVAGDCWLWTGAVRAHGSNGVGEPYGGVHHRDGVRLVHRVAYELVHGPIPVGMHIDHICHTTLCFRPDHLRAVSPSENTNKAALLAAGDKGRASRWGHPR